MMNPDPFPQPIKNDCIDLLTRIRDTCHDYFTKPIHTDLKVIQKCSDAEVYLFYCCFDHCFFNYPPLFYSIFIVSIKILFKTPYFWEGS